MFTFYLCFKKESHSGIAFDMNGGGDMSRRYDYPLFLFAHAMDFQYLSIPFQYAFNGYTNYLTICFAF